MKIFSTIKSFAYNCFNKYPTTTIFLGTFTATYIPMHQIFIKPLKKDVEKLQFKLDTLNEQLLYKENFLNKLLQENNLSTDSIVLTGETLHQEAPTDTIE